MRSLGYLPTCDGILPRCGLFHAIQLLIWPMMTWPCTWDPSLIEPAPNCRFQSNYREHGSHTSSSRVRLFKSRVAISCFELCSPWRQFHEVVDVLKLRLKHLVDWIDPLAEFLVVHQNRLCRLLLFRRHRLFRYRLKTYWNAFKNKKMYSTLSALPLWNADEPIWIRISSTPNKLWRLKGLEVSACPLQTSLQLIHRAGGM